MGMTGMFMGASDTEIDALHQNPPEIHAFLASKRGSDLCVDVDKTWQAIHFLLTGEPHGGPLPLGFVFGGEAVGEENISYGPAQSIRSGQVSEIAAALLPLPPEVLLERYDHDICAAEEIYGCSGDEFGVMAYIGPHYRDLRQLIFTLSERNLGLLHYIF